MNNNRGQPRSSKATKRMRIGFLFVSRESIELCMEQDVIVPSMLVRVPAAEAGKF